MRGTRNSYAPASTKPLATPTGSSSSSAALSSLALSCSSTSQACHMSANGFQTNMSRMTVATHLPM